MAYSSGFSPHPRISYANASPTGAATEAEYLEIGLAIACDPERVRTALDAALPEGLVIMTVVEAEPGPLADRLTGSVWQIVLPGVDEVAARRAVAQLLGQDQVSVERMTKNGMRRFDARAAVVQMDVVSASGATASEHCRLRVVLEHLTPLVRPDDVLSALDLVPPLPPVITRLRQGTLVGAEVEDPLAPRE